MRDILLPNKIEIDQRTYALYITYERESLVTYIA